MRRCQTNVAKRNEPAKGLLPESPAETMCRQAARPAERLRLLSKAYVRPSYNTRPCVTRSRNDTLSRDRLHCAPTKTLQGTLPPTTRAVKWNGQVTRAWRCIVLYEVQHLGGCQDFAPGRSLRPAPQHWSRAPVGRSEHFPAPGAHWQVARITLPVRGVRRRRYDVRCPISRESWTQTDD